MFKSNKMHTMIFAWAAHGFSEISENVIFSKLREKSAKRKIHVFGCFFQDG